MPRSAYWLVVFGPGDEVVGEAELLCGDDVEAAMYAFTTSSPFGHELWCEHGFLGRFEVSLSRGETGATRF